MKYELVIFDWDGTLADSTGRIVDSMRRAGAEVGLPVVPDADIQNIIGLGLPEAIKTVWPDVRADQMEPMRSAYARYFVYDSQISMNLFDGVEALLGNLTAGACKVAVATGKSRKGLNRIFDDLSLERAFNATRCADETQSKPHPQMLTEILEQLGVSVDRAVMVGDTTYDLEMAAAIGMDSIGMSHGAHDEARLRACGPQVICHSINELSDWIGING